MPSTTSSVGLEALGLLDRDDAVLADLLHRLGDDARRSSASLLARDGADLGDLLRVLGRLGELLASSSTTASTALSMPRLSSIGLAPAATILQPSRKIAWASTVAVVVPSPATSEVLEATSLTIWAPMFSNGSSSSISLATVTPSLVTVGAPKLFSRTTLRPLGPRVTLTASASVSTPSRICSRASCVEDDFFGCHVLYPPCRESVVLSARATRRRRGRRPRAG